MKQQTTFLWGWKDYPPTLDKLMTRQRMARLMWAWRRAMTQGWKVFDVKLIKREKNRHEYRVSTTTYCPKDYATIVILKGYTP